MSESDATRRQQQADHLTQVRALSQEVASAISALERNDLPKFESTVAAQESLCNKLVATTWMLPPAPAEAAAQKESPRDGLIEEVRQAHLALAQLNRVYAALLKRSKRSSDLVATLYRSYGQGYGKSASSEAEHHSWSCEV